MDREGEVCAGTLWAVGCAIGMSALPVATTVPDSSFFFPFALSSAFFFFPKPNNLRLDLWASSAVSPTLGSASLLSADLDTGRFVASWKPSPSKGIFEVLAGCRVVGIGVLGTRVLDSEALIVEFLDC